ncbi:MAG: hypothetical protein ACI4VQ_07580 [Clostridia bacterium]
MKVIKIKKKTILKMTMIMVFALIVCKVSTSLGMQHYYTVDFSTGLVTATVLNVRSGPGTQYNILNSSYNYTGIGVVSSSKYGKIYVQIFIGK